MLQIRRGHALACTEFLKACNRLQKQRGFRLEPPLLVEQVTGIEPAYSAWEADPLPLSYTCLVLFNYNIKYARCQVPERILSKNFLSTFDNSALFFLLPKKLRKLR